jgi:hypothetical protein
VHPRSPEAYDQKFKTLKTNPQLQAVTPLFTSSLPGFVADEIMLKKEPHATHKTDIQSAPKKSKIAFEN